MLRKKCLHFGTFFFFFKFGCTVLHAESSSPTRDLNLGPLPWEHRVLATGPPEKSLALIEQNLRVFGYLVPC